MAPIEFTEDDLFPGIRAASYRGTGRLIVGQGDNVLEQPCEFICVQMGHGSVRCYCEWDEGPLHPLRLWIAERAMQLIGTCSEGSPLEGSPLKAGPLTTTTTPICAQASERNVATFDVRELEVGSETGDRTSSLSFHFVNLDLGSRREWESKWKGAWPQRGWIHRGLNIALAPAKDYERAINELKDGSKAQITAISSVSGEQGTEVATAVDAMRDLCLLLSLATGTLVQWAYYDALDESGGVRRSYHYSPATKSLTSLRLIAYEDLHQYLTETLPSVAALDPRWRFRDAVLSLIDAKAEADLLEARGLKVAVILDFLCARFREMVDQETLLPRADFKRWTKAVKPKVEELSLESLGRERGEVVCEMLKHWNEFNRPTFRTSLRQFVVCLGLSDCDLSPVTEIRNTLVHDLRFPSQCRQPQNAGLLFQEYCLLLNLTERILLAMLCYTGYHNDWRKFGRSRSELRTQIEYTAGLRP